MYNVNKILEKYPVVKFIDHPSYELPETALKLNKDINVLKLSSKGKKIYADNMDTYNIYKMCVFDSLSKEEETHLFQQLNFFRRKANQLRQNLINDHAVRSFIKTHKKIIEIRNTILNCNMRLVFGFLKKRPELMKEIMESVSNAVLIMFRAIDGFDWSKGFKFSTYAMWALTTGTYRDLVPDSPNRLMKNKYSLEENFDHNSIVDTSSPVDCEIDKYKYNEDMESLLREFSKQDPLAHKVVIMNKGIGCNPKKATEICKILKINRRKFDDLRRRGLKKLRELIPNYPSLYQCV